MNAATQPPARDTTADPRRQRWLLALAVVLLATSAYFIWQHFRGTGINVETERDRPLLGSGGGEFRDAQVGIRFNAPPRWGMQTRSIGSSQSTSKDRLLVKYKRLLPNAPAAWFRVHVVEAPKEQAIADVVKDYPPGHDWTVRGSVDTQSIGGHPAAQLRYVGNYHGFASYRDIVGVRTLDQVFVFVSTYRALDSAAQQESRQAMSTVLFESR